MEVIPDGVIDESLSYLGFTTGLILEHYIIIPPKPNRCMQNLKKWTVTTNQWILTIDWKANN